MAKMTSQPLVESEPCTIPSCHRHGGCNIHKNTLSKGRPVVDSKSRSNSERTMTTTEDSIIIIEEEEEQRQDENNINNSSSSNRSIPLYLLVKENRDTKNTNALLNYLQDFPKLTIQPLDWQKEKEKEKEQQREQQQEEQPTNTNNNNTWWKEFVKVCNGPSPITNNTRKIINKENNDILQEHQLLLALEENARQKWRNNNRAKQQQQQQHHHQQQCTEEQREGQGLLHLLVRPNVAADPVWKDLCANAKRNHYNTMMKNRNKNVLSLLSAVVNQKEHRHKKKVKKVFEKQDSDISQTIMSNEDKVLLMVNLCLNDKDSLPGYVYRCLLEEFMKRCDRRQQLKESQDEFDRIVEDNIKSRLKYEYRKRCEERLKIKHHQVVTTAADANNNNNNNNDNDDNVTNNSSKKSRKKNKRRNSSKKIDYNDVEWDQWLKLQHEEETMKLRECRRDVHGVIKHVTATLFEVRPGFCSSSQIIEMTTSVVEGLVLSELYTYIMNEIVELETKPIDDELTSKIINFEMYEQQFQHLSEEAIVELQIMPKEHTITCKLRQCVLFVEKLSKHFAQVEEKENEQQQEEEEMTTTAAAAVNSYTNSDEEHSSSSSSSASTATNRNSSNSNTNNLLLITADSLIPMVCQHIIAAKVPNIHAEIEFLQEFVQSEYLLRGKEGYALVTIQAALHYLNTQCNDYNDFTTKLSSSSTQHHHHTNITSK